MTKITILIKPFIKNQLVYVYEDGNKKDALEVEFDKIPTTIVELTAKYSAYDVELVGPKQYSKGIGKQILEEGLVKYKENKIQIKYK